MNGIHDLGGMDGFGPVEYDGGSEEVFRADWERVALSMFPQGARAGFFNLDQFRHAIERMDPAEYLVTNYYEHWTHVIEDLAPAKGAFTMAELEERTQFYLDNPDAPLPSDSNPEILEFLNAILVSGAPCDRPSDAAPTFAVGDVVTVRDDQPAGHTRRARYVQGKTGVISALRGSFVYPDTNASHDDEAPAHVYTVMFTSDELWGAEFSGLKDAVYVDLWEPYLELANVTAGTGA
jgi:nitrile hydratase beta subunit